VSAILALVAALAATRFVGVSTAHEALDGWLHFAGSNYRLNPGNRSGMSGA